MAEDNLTVIQNNHFEIHNQELFDIKNNNHNNPSDRLKRIKSISRSYGLWINHHRKHFNCQNDTENEPCISNMYDIINTKFNPSYNFRHFLLDYKFVINRKELLLNEQIKASPETCNAATCVIIDRNNRDREYYGNNTLRRNKLYFISNNTQKDINQEISRNISTQQILDSLHSFIHHTIHIDNNAYLQLYNHKNDNDDIELDIICHDDYAQKISELIETTINSSKQYRAIDTQSKPANKKFITANQIEDVCRQQNGISNGKSILRSVCFMDKFVVQVNKSLITKNNIEKICCFLTDEEYDSESIIQDLEERKCSNLRTHLSSSNRFCNLLNRLVVKRQVSRSLYSSGYRYFYWDFYRNNLAESTVIFGKSTGDYNPGYKHLKDWYIPKKYENFKFELLNNRVKTFSLEQYNTTFVKANDKLKVWNSDDVDPLICRVDAWERYYGIRKGEKICLEHILALLFYTNYSKQCYEFSATYRKLNAFESDGELIHRHSEYHNWGKLLRECVECFGESMENSKFGVFFHGIGASLIFNSTTIRLCGPVSTTGKFDVAVNTFGKGGIVLDIKRRDVNQFYFNCPFWSDFTHEDEKLFIGGLVHFEFDTIRDLKNKLNYYNYIQPLTMFHFMIEGWQFKEKIKKWHYRVLKLLIQEELDEKALEGTDSIVPAYVLKLWHHFLSEIKNVEINWRYMKMVETSKKTRFGYKIFSPTFCLKRYTSLDFGIFIRLLPNCEKISLFNGKKDRFKESIELTDTLTKHLLKTIDMINKNNSLAINELNIVLPCDEYGEEGEEIENYILENEEQFNDEGWELKQDTFKSEFHVGFEKCDYTLCIKKLKL